MISYMSFQLQQTLTQFELPRILRNGQRIDMCADQFSASLSFHGDLPNVYRSAALAVVILQCRFMW